jgi:hypothetical protein
MSAACALRLLQRRRQLNTCSDVGRTLSSLVRVHVVAAADGTGLEMYVRPVDTMLLRAGKPALSTAAQVYEWSTDKARFSL